MNRHSMAFLTFVSLSVIACGGGRGDEPAATSATSAPAAAPAQQVPPTAPDAAIGVPECDDYLKKYAECIGHMPTAVHTQAQHTVAETRKQWQQAAATDQGRAGLAAGCQAATDAARTSMQKFGCSF